jgi:hypothetical protein
MTLALGQGVLHQRCVIQPRRVRQDRSGHFNNIVKRQRADHFPRGVGRHGKPASESRAGGNFDAFDELSHHVIEQIDLIFGELARTVHEQVSDLPQDFRAPQDILVRQRVV